MGVKGGEPPIYMPTLSRASTRQSTEAQQDELPHYDDDNDSVAAPTFLQPRVAAVLGVSEGWHPVLFACRLLSIVPSILYGVPITFQFLAKLHSIIMAEDGAEQGKWSFENRFLLTESFLAIGWCGCSGYLSFFFTDCLMSRWLVNYDPLATVVRLVAMTLLNGYLQSWTLYLSGSSGDPLLLLPTWICITSTLTIMYHITQRKINIRKETSISISVFSIASFISMVALLLQLHWNRTEWSKIPIISLAVGAAQYANLTAQEL